MVKGIVQFTETLSCMQWTDTNHLFWLNHYSISSQNCFRALEIMIHLRMLHSSIPQQDQYVMSQMSPKLFNQHLLFHWLTWHKLLIKLIWKIVHKPWNTMKHAQEWENCLMVQVEILLNLQNASIKLQSCTAGKVCCQMSGLLQWVQEYQNCLKELV